jgi:hypothetical protein
MVLVQANGRVSPHESSFYHLRNPEASCEIAEEHPPGCWAGEDEIFAGGIARFQEDD